MKIKHRIIEILTIVFGTALIVFMVRNCGDPIQAVQEPIPLTILSITIEDEDCDDVVFKNLTFVGPSEPAWNQFEQECPCGLLLSGTYEGDEYYFKCFGCERVYAHAWQGI